MIYIFQGVPCIARNGYGIKQTCFGINNTLIATRKCATDMFFCSFKRLIRLSGRTSVYLKKNMKTPTTWVEGVEVFWILEPNIIVYSSCFCRYHFNTSNTQKSGQLSNKNTWKTTPTQKNQVHTQETWKWWVESLTPRGHPISSRWGLPGPRVATPPRHRGQSGVSPRPPRWENLEASARNLGVGFGPVKPVGCFRNHQENHCLHV